MSAGNPHRNSQRFEDRANFRFWHKADIPIVFRDDMPGVVKWLARSIDKLARPFSDNSCDPSHSFPPLAQVTLRLVNGSKAMIDLLIGYAVAIAIVFIASRPLSIDRLRW